MSRCRAYPKPSSRGRRRCFGCTGSAETLLGQVARQQQCQPSSVPGSRVRQARRRRERSCGGAAARGCRGRGQWMTGCRSTAPRVRAGGPDCAPARVLSRGAGALRMRRRASLLQSSSYQRQSAAADAAAAALWAPLQPRACRLASAARYENSANASCVWHFAARLTSMRARARRWRRHPRNAARRGPHALRRRRLPPPLPPPALQGCQARAAAALLRGLPARGVPCAHALRGARAVQLVRHGEPVHLRGLLRCAAARHAGAPPAAPAPPPVGRRPGSWPARAGAGGRAAGPRLACALAGCVPQGHCTGWSRREQRARKGTISTGAASVGPIDSRNIWTACCRVHVRRPLRRRAGAPGPRVDTWPARERGGCRVRIAHGGGNLAMQVQCSSHPEGPAAVRRACLACAWAALVAVRAAMWAAERAGSPGQNQSQAAAEM